MNSKYSLLFAKTNDSSHAVTDLEDTYNIVCLEIPRLESKEVADVTSQTWSGEDGEDAYIPSELKMKAFDWEITCAVKASSISAAKASIDSFISYLKGGDGLGSSVDIYSSYVGTGRQKAYYSSYEDKDYWTDAEGMTVVQFKVKFRITDPTTEVVPDSSTNPTKLAAQ